MFASYRRLFGHPGVPAVVTVTLAARAGTPMFSLALLLAATERLGSYATAGLMLTGHAIAVAACAPAGGRLADRLGPRRALGGYLAAHTAGYALLLATLAVRAPLAVLVAAACLLGATTPPVAAVVRGAWPRLVPGDMLATAYAVDNALNELMFIAGPVLVAALTPLMPARAVIGVAGGCVLLATAALLATPAAARPEPTPARPEPASEGTARQGGTGASRAGRFAGPLTHRPTLLLLGIAATGAFCFGCLRIATAAAAGDAGSPGSAGVLLGLLSAGALGGALVHGARPRPGAGRALLIGLSVLEAASMAAAATVPGLPLLAGLMIAAGLVAGPRDTLAETLLGEHAPARYRTEVFAWLNTFMWGGYGLGTALAGRLTGPGDGGTAAFGVAAAVALLAVVPVTALRLPPVGRPVQPRPSESG